ncbi:hypothetical protein [Nocardia callitridis]|uniref:ESX-1 secretion-associated protein EspA/EspE-like domain-containing protein n=1 Tax=Nocardia callitridis TaxID=648753 RepID=A0ABP9L0K0_9NOCA
MRSTDTTPTLSEVQSQWDPAKLREMGEGIKTRGGEFMDLVGATVEQIRQAGSHWSGDAYFAAYDRVAGDRDAAQKVADEIANLAQAFIDGGGALVGYRNVLLSKVATATDAGFTVGDDWTVSGSANTADPDGDLYSHQTAITTALNEMLGAQTDVETSIRQCQDVVAQRTEQLGDGDPLDIPNGDHAQDNPSLAVLGQQIAATTPPAAPETEPQPAESGAPVAGAPVSDDQPATNSQPATDDPPSTAPAPEGATVAAAAPVAQPGGSPAGGSPESTTAPESPESAPAGSSSAAPAPAPAGQPASAPTAAMNPESWTPQDVTSLITAVGGITGTVPELLTAAGEVGKGLVEAAGNAAGQFADAADQVANTFEHAVGNDDPGAAPPPPPDRPAPDGQPPGGEPPVDDQAPPGTDEPSEGDEPSEPAEGDESASAEGESTQPSAAEVSDQEGPDPNASTSSLFGLPAVYGSGRDRQRRSEPVLAVVDPGSDDE